MAHTRTEHPTTRLPRTPWPLRLLAAATLLMGILQGTIAHAELDDLPATPGLWKTTVRIVHDGHAGNPTVHWHCLLEDDDPWTSFANLPVPGASCRRTRQQVGKTSLDWSLECPAQPDVSGAHAHVGFSDNGHYTGSIVSSNRHELLRVDGERRAGCNEPNG